jgi:hypothetical protein
VVEAVALEMVVEPVVEVVDGEHLQEQVVVAIVQDLLL